MRSAILLDVPNLLSGRPTPSSTELLSSQLAAIDQCALRLFGDAEPQRDAFALDRITARSVGETLEAYGYSVTWCSSDRTKSMDLKRMSRVDDYALQRTAKLRAREGVGALLIASADRDPEEVAFDLGGSGVRVAFAQWDEIPRSRATQPERVCLRQYERNVPEPRPLGPSISVSRGGVTLSNSALRDGMVIGRPSRRYGVPDVDVSAGAHSGEDGFSYSRRLGMIRKLGDAWALWLLPESEADLVLPDGGRPPAGACVLLPPGPFVMKMPSAGVELAVTTAAAESAR